jgi:hypothetical protein
MPLSLDLPQIEVLRREAADLVTEIDELAKTEIHPSWKSPDSPEALAEMTFELGGVAGELFKARKTLSTIGRLLAKPCEL